MTMEPSREVNRRVPAEFDDVVVWAAWLYYEESLNQSDIAGIIGVSRATIVNYLQEARERGVVRIAMDAGVMARSDLSREICERFGLSETLVVQHQPGADAQTRLLTLGAAGARQLERMIDPGEILCVSWGKTVLAVADALKPMSDVDGVTVVQVTGAGIDRLDQEFCAQNDIKVCNVISASAQSVAEYCIYAALTISRRLSRTSDEIFLGNYAEIRGKIIKDRMFSLSGLTVGFIGFGSIGQETARMFHAMGCKIQYHDPSNPTIAENLSKISKKIVKGELLRTSDIVSIHVPLVKQTQNLISSEELSSMKETGILLNASRGGVVDEHALAQAIQNEEIKGAAVDVFASEPPDKKNPLLNLPKEFRDNIILTPHIGGITVQSWAELFSRSWINIQRFFDGEELENQQI